MIDYTNDDHLADAVQHGDIAAQEAFFNRFQVTLLKFAMKKGFSREDAEDLAQETLAVGFRTIASFRRGERIVRWLAGIEVNFMRRRWAAQSQDEVLDEGNETAASMWRFQQQAYTKARTLSPDEVKERARLWADTQLYMSLARNQMHMKVVQLFYLDKLTYPEIEAKLGLAKDTAKVYRQRGLKYLKKMRDAKPPEDSPRAKDS